jgi:hypothetical protein
VTDAALAVERQFHAIGVGNDIAEVACAAVAWIFAKLGVRFEIVGATVVTILELVWIVEQRVLGSVHIKYRRRIVDGEQQGGAGRRINDTMPSIERW